MLAIQLLFFAAPVVLAKARKVVWFNDNGLYNHYVTRKGYLGPDGPWHALVTGHWSMRDNLLYIPVWPTGSLDTIMPAEEAGGVYEGHEIVNTTDGSRRVPDSVQYQWPNVRPNDYGSETPDWYLNNEMQLLWADEKDDQGYAYDSVNASVREVLNWTSPYIDTTPDEDQYQRAVGILGLGKIIGSDGERQSEELGMPPSILDQLVDDGTIATRSWFMHIGSVNPLVVPSLVLGGYESNRVLGGVGIFDFDEDWKLPRLFLIDVTLGYELGLSPFDDPVGSVWGANTYEIGTHGEGSGAPNGSVMTTPDASLPYIYLPPGVCEAAAEHLPVSWNETARLYFWEESSRSEKLTNTSAYMGFVFSDRNNQNVSIKVPLALLYLLTDPYREGVNRSTRYWPCKPWSDKVDGGGPGSGLWPLGRAFLQAALIGYNYDRPRFYLAQAPGPGHGEGVVVDDNNTDRIFSAPTSFKETWRSSWEEIPGPRWNSGTVVAIILGVSAGLLGVTGAVMITRRFLSARSRKKSAGADAGEADRFMGGKTEMDGSGGITVVETGPGLPHELPTSYSPLPRAEVVGDGVVYELPVESHHQAPEREGVADKKINIDESCTAKHQ